MNALHATVPLPVGPASPWSGQSPSHPGVMNRIALGLRRWRQRRAMRELLELDERLLDDIGLTREQVVVEARKATWFFEPAPPRLFRSANGELW